MLLHHPEELSVWLQLFNLAPHHHLRRILSLLLRLLPLPQGLVLEHHHSLSLSLSLSLPPYYTTTTNLWQFFGDSVDTSVLATIARMCF
jgi:hypothetical protein